MYIFQHIYAKISVQIPQKKYLRASKLKLSVLLHFSMYIAIFMCAVCMSLFRHIAYVCQH